MIDIILNLVDKCKMHGYHSHSEWPLLKETLKSWPDAIKDPGMLMYIELCLIKKWLLTSKNIYANIDIHPERLSYKWYIHHIDEMENVTLLEESDGHNYPDPDLALMTCLENCIKHIKKQS